MTASAKPSIDWFIGELARSARSVGHGNNATNPVWRCVRTRHVRFWTAPAVFLAYRQS